MGKRDRGNANTDLEPVELLDLDAALEELEKGQFSGRIIEMRY